MLLALGTANDWIGRTTDFAGIGVVVLVAATAAGGYLAARTRLGPGAAAATGAGAGLGMLLVVELFGLQPSAWWVLLISAYAVVAAWDLRRTVRRTR
ncbi:MAG: hypothetical protein KY460_07645 [Actinobacteria bacterium]|nr:hypothetical protein [Actinomycetota bacterium]